MKYFLSDDFTMSLIKCDKMLSVLYEMKARNYITKACLEKRKEIQGFLKMCVNTRWPVSIG